MFQKTVGTTLFLIALTFSAQADADLVKFRIEWDGAAFGNSATAVGRLIVDDSLLPNPGSYFGPFGGAFVDFEITVIGATAGNGIYTLIDGDFEDFVIWEVDSPVDLTQDLFGQTGFSDFNFFGEIGSNAPAGSGPLTITTAEDTGDQLAMTSFMAVPEPTSMALFCLAGSSLLLRRRRK